ncbi:MAG: ABC transporter substrate-binding protein [Lachnospiraceae bacterium]|nr:ABC transporter substrate-binding protein [Lachnospiraceae bacterium]
MKNFKKAAAMLMALCMAIGAIGCSSKSEPAADKPAATEAPAKTDSTVKEEKPEATKAPEKEENNTAEDTAGPAADTETEASGEEPEEETVEQKVFANGIYINEEGTYCNPDGSTVDLGGMEVILADWFTKEEGEPQTAYEEATYEYRQEIQEKYNFTVRPEKISGYGTYQEKFTNFATSGGEENYVYCMDNQFLMTPMMSGLFYDLASIDVLDFTEEKWNSSIAYMTTMGKAVYGMRAQATEPRGGVFWNKRLFKEAGLEPDLPYDLQAKNEWNWDTFEDLCKALAIDSDNDGVTDLWPMTSFSGDLMNATIASNGAQLIDRDENGKFFLAGNSDPFIQAYDWIAYMRRNYEMPSKSNGGEVWDYSYTSFQNAEAAMIVTEEYKASVFNEQMEDDYGFVMFPHGPSVDDLTGYSKDNTYVIPSCYDPERAWKIAFVYNLYTEPTPGYEEDDDWKTAYYPIFRDERAVDETLELMRSHQRALIYPLVPKANTDNEYYWNIDSETASERYEVKKDEYQSYIDAIQK